MLTARVRRHVGALADTLAAVPREALVRCLDATGRAGWSLERLAACLDGYSVGAVRASLGIASNTADVERLLAVVAGDDPVTTS